MGNSIAILFVNFDTIFVLYKNKATKTDKIAIFETNQPIIVELKKLEKNAMFVVRFNNGIFFEQCLCKTHFCGNNELMIVGSLRANRLESICSGLEII